VVADQRRDEATAFIGAAERWAASRPDIVAALIVGSWARDDAREDSDIDLVLLTEDPDVYIEGEDWIEDLAPGARLIRTGDWGAIIERRLLLPSSSLEVEVGVGRPSWAATSPVDPGTRNVVRGGFRPLFDPQGLLAALASVC
jgi:hypothetical protein